MAKLLQLSRPNRRVGDAVRAWWAMRSQKRRRHRGMAGGGAPGAPSNLQAEDLAGGVGLTWDMTGVDGEEGCSIEARDVDLDEAFHQLGTTGPDVGAFQFDAGGGSHFQCRLRAFNASGYSAYSNVADIILV